MVWTGIGAAGAAAAGQWISNWQSQAHSREQMRFQERMSSTAYQRAVKDMKKAGINPMLAAGAGGASSPQGSSAKAENVAAPAISSALDAVNTMAQKDLLKAQRDYTSAQETTERQKHLQGLFGAELIGGERARGKPDVQLSIVAAEMLTRLRSHQATSRRTHQQAQLEGILAQLAEAKLPSAKILADFYKTDWGSQIPIIRQYMPLIKALIAGIHSAAAGRR